MWIGRREIKEIKEQLVTVCNVRMGERERMRDINTDRRTKYGPEMQDSICARKFGLHTDYATKAYSSKLIASHNLSSWI